MKFVKKSLNITKEIQEEIEKIRFEQRYYNEADVIREALEVGIQVLKERGQTDVNDPKR